MRIDTHPVRHWTSVNSERVDRLAALTVVVLGSLMLWIAIIECIRVAIAMDVGRPLAFLVC
jgi:hypothetical protein